MSDGEGSYVGQQPASGHDKVLDDLLDSILERATRETMTHTIKWQHQQLLKFAAQLANCEENRESARSIILRRVGTLKQLLAPDANQAALEELERLKFFAERMV